MLKKIFQGFMYLIVMVGLGFLIYYFFLQPNPQLIPAKDLDNLSTKSLFAAKLPDQNNLIQPISQYQGKIIVVNFWATWCPPCREEMPELSALQKDNAKNDVVVLGIAIDTVELVKEFSLTTPVSYPLLVSEEEGMVLGMDLGNDKGVLPYTVIIDRQGKVVKTFFGRVNKHLLESTIKNL